MLNSANGDYSACGLPVLCSSVSLRRHLAGDVVHATSKSPPSKMLHQRDHVATAFSSACRVIEIARLDAIRFR
jgi:hypothetical protein